MTVIIYGFIISIWVVLNLIYFRLGKIMIDLEKICNDSENSEE